MTPYAGAPAARLRRFADEPNQREPAEFGSEILLGGAMIATPGLGGILIPAVRNAR